jgi:DNA-binding IclR family transcriptional regulator
MEHGDDRRYSLGLKLSELGALARAELDAVTACTPVLDALSTATRETVLLGAVDWDALELTIVGGRVSPQVLSVIPSIGRRLTIPPGCLGKALLLGLSEAETDSALARLPLPALTSKTHTDRAQLASEIRLARPLGFVVAEEEYLDGVSGVAVPVMFEDGRPQAAVGVVGPSSRMAGEFARIGQLMLELTAGMRPLAKHAPQAAA